MDNNTTGKNYTFQITGMPVEITETNIEPNIKLIAGKINNCSTIYYWLIDEELDFEIGDYAIVENINDYDLIKIVGIVETQEKYLKHITNVNKNKMKKVAKVIQRCDIREES